MKTIRSIKYAVSQCFVMTIGFFIGLYVDAKMNAKYCYYRIKNNPRRSILWISVLAIFVILLFVIGCSSVPAPTGLRALEKRGYCKWDGAPAWMARDFIYDDFGLIDGISFNASGQKCYLLSIDLNTDPEGLDGKCDNAVIVCETGVSKYRKWGALAPAVMVQAISKCDNFQKVKEKIKLDKGL